MCNKLSFEYCWPLLRSKGWGAFQNDPKVGIRWYFSVGTTATTDYIRRCIYMIHVQYMYRLEVCFYYCRMEMFVQLEHEMERKIRIKSEIILWWKVDG